MPKRTTVDLNLSDPSQWPFWMTTDEVLHVLRVNLRSFQRGRVSGEYKFKPVRRGVWARSDIWTHMGYGGGPGPVAEPPADRPVKDPLATRKRMVDDRFKKKPRPFPPPADPERYEEYLNALELWLRPGFEVEPSGDRWLIRFKGRPLPVGVGQPIRLTRAVQLTICDQMRDIRQGVEPREGRF